MNKKKVVATIVERLSCNLARVQQKKASKLCAVKNHIKVRSDKKDLNEQWNGERSCRVMFEVGIGHARSAVLRTALRSKFRLFIKESLFIGWTLVYEVRMYICS